MKNRNVKVIDEHNIDRNANVMFALDLEGSEYVVYWIERDTESNNVFVSKVLKNLDNTYNILNIDDDNKKKEISDTVKILISNSVSDQNDKLVGTTTTLSNGKNVRFIDVSFNKEQNINVSKTYITTVKKEVTKVAEDYYDVVVEETKVADVLPSVTPVVETVSDIFPEVPVASAPVVETPVLSVPEPTPLVVSAPVVEAPQVVPEVVMPSVVQPTPVVVEPIVVPQPVVEPAPAVVAPTPVSVPNTVTAPVVEPTPVVSVPVNPTPATTPEVVPTPVVDANQPLVFNATKETNLNAALGEVANSAAIPVENIQPVREFGVETPVAAPAVQQSAAAPIEQPSVTPAANIVTGKAGFANSKFFMVVAIAFFLASCVFLGYEVFNYFQLVK